VERRIRQLLKNDAYVWAPSKERITNSNLKRLMDRNRIKSFQELYQKSIADPEWFWNAANEDLAIEWYKPYNKVLDVAKGVPWAKWFVGGRINVAHNCLDKHQTDITKSKVAIISESEAPSDRRELTYSELFKLTNQIAHALKSDMQLTKGDKVGIYLPMIPEAIASFLAVAKIGAVVVPIFSGYGAKAVSERLSDCDAKAVITTESFTRRGKKVEVAEAAFEAARSVPSLKSILICENNQQVKPEMIKDVKLFSWDTVRKKPPVFQTEQMESEDPFMIIYTSGTTGKPKGAVHVHGGFQVKNTEEVAYQTDMHPSDTLFWFTDMGWIMAPWEIVGGLSLGGTLLIYSGAPDYPTPDRLWRVVERNKANILGVSPTLVRGMMRYGTDPIKKHDLSSLQAIGSTGEPWNPESYNWLFENVGMTKCPIINLSGGTEVGTCFLSVHPIVPLKACSLGGPSLGISADVLDENGRPIRNQTGELVVTKPWPSMTRSLWKNDDRYIQTYWSRFPNVWVHGDWASIDSDGYWYLHGRSDDTLKIAGKRVGPAEIESALASHEAVLESVAIGVPDPLKGEAIVCFVVLRPGKTQSKELESDIQRHVAKELSETMRPSSIKFVESIPKTRNAKLVRRLVRSKYLGLPLGDMSNLENPEALEAIANAR
jgi:acetyl-CoA synthetase